MKLLFTIFAILIINSAFSQNVDFKKKNFETPEAYQTAKSSLEEGNAFFFAGEFDKALKPFKKAYALNSNNALLNFKVGVCYLKTDNLLDALPYFKKAQGLDPQVDPKISFALAQAYQANKNYQNAIDSYNRYLSSLSDKEKASENSKVQKNLDICEAELQKIKSNDEHAAELEAEKAKAEADKEKAKKLEEEQKTLALETEVKTEEVVLSSSVTKKAIASTSSKVIYKIQILSASKSESAIAIKKIYKGPLKVMEVKVGKSYKYYIGNFNTRAEVLKAIPKTKVKGAFPVRFKNGKRM